MKTTQINAQEMPAQTYNPDETARIAEILVDAYDPEYMLLFGSLAGSIPHSEVLAYDLLIVTQDVSYYGWQGAKRLLKMKFQPKYREIPYVNIYVLTQGELSAGNVPIMRLVRAEGVLLYSNEHCRFKRPKSPFDFQTFFCDTKKYADTFQQLGVNFLKQANDGFRERDLRQAAFSVGQAAELFYRTLYFVYHGREQGSRDLVVMHERVRTLSAELMLLFEGDHIQGENTLQELNDFLIKARYDAAFTINPHKLESYLGKVGKLSKVVHKVCQRRIDLYKQRIVK